MPNAHSSLEVFQEEEVVMGGEGQGVRYTEMWLGTQRSPARGNWETGRWQGENRTCGRRRADKRLGVPVAYPLGGRDGAPSKAPRTGKEERVWQPLSSREK
jgi:hypothetical protein